MKLRRYYMEAVLSPSVFVLLFVVIFTIADSRGQGWQSSKSALMSAIGTSIVYFIIVCVLALSIFLNRIKGLAGNLVWNLVTWFTLPFAYLIYVVYNDIKNRILYNFGLGKGLLYLILMTSPYFIGLVWSFIKYRQSVERA